MPAAIDCAGVFFEGIGRQRHDGHARQAQAVLAFAQLARVAA